MRLFVLSALALLVVVVHLAACGVQGGGARASDAGGAPPGADAGSVAGDLDGSGDGASPAADVAGDTEPDTPAAPVVPAVSVVTDRDYKKAAIELIGTAAERIEVFQFEFRQTGSAKDIRNALLAAASKGVTVRVLLDDEPEENEATADFLLKGGVDVKLDQNSKRVHVKLIAADAARILVGSTNLSGASIDFNHEANVLVTEPAAVAFLVEYIEALWKSVWLDPKTVSGDAGADVVPWVDGGHVALALPAIDAAAGRIDVAMYTVNLNLAYPDGPSMKLVQGLAAAAKRGTKVRVLLEKSSFDASLNSQNQAAEAWLEQRGVSVRFDTAEVATHAKLVIADEVGLVGTNNWTYSGLEIDHEAGVLFRTPEAVADLAEWFEARWKEGN